MMTVSREILTHPDFMTNLADELCGMLEALIDAEFDKGDDTDFDFIDECANAINAIRSRDNAQILPYLSRKDFLKKVGIKTERKFKVLVAACAALAILFTAGTQIEVEENISIVQALSGMVSDFFTNYKQVEEATTQPETTDEIAVMVSIIVETTDEFKTEYYTGEDFNSAGIKVYVEYLDGGRRLMQPDEYKIEVPESFGKKVKYEEILIRSDGFTHGVVVRVMENSSTKKLNSIYAVFPDDFDFTTEDLHNFDHGIMQVYAVYSDGSERELSADEYFITEVHEGLIIDRYITVIVEYEGCSCSFMVYKE